MSKTQKEVWYAVIDGQLNVTLKPTIETNRQGAIKAFMNRYSAYDTWEEAKKRGGYYTARIEIFWDAPSSFVKTTEDK